MRQIPAPHTHMPSERRATDMSVHEAWLQLESVMREAGYVIPHSHSLRKHVTDILQQRARRHSRMFGAREALDVVQEAISRHQYETLVQQCAASELRNEEFMRFLRTEVQHSADNPIDNVTLLAHARSVFRRA